MDAARFGRGQVKGVEQIIGRCQHLINREHFRKARGFSANLDVETRVLRVEHVEQRTAADRKLLAIGQQQLVGRLALVDERSEEHTSELQSLMRISYAVFCLKKKKNKQKNT